MWGDNHPWVAAALGDEESVKLLLDNGANSRMRGACAMTPLDMATFEEHEAVVQQLLADNEDSNFEIEIIEDNRPGDSAEVKISIPPFHSDPDNVSEASQVSFDFPQPLQPLTAAILKTHGLKTLSHRTIFPIRVPVYRGLDTLWGSAVVLYMVLHQHRRRLYRTCVDKRSGVP